MTNRRANCDMWSSPGFTVGAALRGRPRFTGHFVKTGGHRVPPYSLTIEA